MADIFTPEKRSYVMSRIRSKNTGIDVAMRDMLAEMGCDFEAYPKMFGNPDFVIREKRITIFCDGDFWHGYKYSERKKPAKKFWRNKIESNMRRDRRVSRKLRSEGWSVLRFWGHDIERRQSYCVNKIRKKIMARRLQKQQTLDD